MNFLNSSLKHVTILISILICGGCQPLTKLRCQIPDGSYIVSDISALDSATKEERRFIDSLQVSYKQRDYKLMYFNVDQCVLTSAHLQYLLPTSPELLYPITIFSDRELSTDRAINGSSFSLYRETGNNKFLLKGNLESDDILKGEMRLSMEGLDFASIREIEVSPSFFQYGITDIGYTVNWAKADTHTHPQRRGGLELKDLIPIPFSTEINFRWEAKLYKDNQ